MTLWNPSYDEFLKDMLSGRELDRNDIDTAFFLGLTDGQRAVVRLFSQRFHYSVHYLQENALAEQLWGDLLEAREYGRERLASGGALGSLFEGHNGPLSNNISQTRAVLRRQMAEKGFPSTE